MSADEPTTPKTMMPGGMADDAYGDSNEVKYLCSNLDKKIQTDTLEQDAFEDAVDTTPRPSSQHTTRSSSRSLTGARSSSTSAAAAYVANGDNVAEALAGKEEETAASERERSASPKTRVAEGGERSKSPLLTTHRISVASGDLDEVDLEGRSCRHFLTLGEVGRCDSGSLLGTAAQDSTCAYTKELLSGRCM